MARRPDERRIPLPLKVCAVAILAAILFRTFGYEAFNIPSRSMMPTLLTGDTVLVSKHAYGFSRYSFPFWYPPLSGRIGGRLPARGDVAVFKLPRDPESYYIKRIVGLPGDRIQMVGGVLTINGQPVPEERVGDFLDRGGTERLIQLVERLPGGSTHAILKGGGHGPFDDTPAWTVPEGCVFAMGDNRDDSEDSRAMEAVGFIPLENLVGEAELRLFSLGDQVRWWELWRWPSALRTDRLLSVVR